MTRPAAFLSQLCATGPRCGFQAEVGSFSQRNGAGRAGCASIFSPLLARAAPSVRAGGHGTALGLGGGHCALGSKWHCLEPFAQLAPNGRFWSVGERSPLCGPVACSFHAARRVQASEPPCWGPHSRSIVGMPSPAKTLSLWCWRKVIAVAFPLRWCAGPAGHPGGPSSHIEQSARHCGACACSNHSCWSCMGSLTAHVGGGSQLQPRQNPRPPAAPTRPAHYIGWFLASAPRPPSHRHNG